MSIEHIYLHWNDALHCAQGSTRSAGFSFISDWTPGEKETLRDIPRDVIEAAAFAPAVLPPEAPLDVGLPMPLAAGMTVVIGLAGSGKSRFVSNLVNTASARIIHWGEPDPWSSRASLVALASMIDTTLVGRDPVVIDSLKPLLITAGSNLGKGGISKAPLSLVDDLSSTFAARGRHLIATLNPFDIVDRDLEVFADMYAAVATHVVLLTDATETSVSGRMRGRTGNRKWRNFNLSGQNIAPSAQVTTPNPTATFKSSFRFNSTTRRS